MTTGRPGDREARRDYLASVMASNSGFRWAIRFSPPRSRQPLAVIYIFCRMMDDLADGDGPIAGRRRALRDWKAFLRDPNSASAPSPTLAEAVVHEALDRSLLANVVDGCLADLQPVRVLRSDEELSAYARQVAGGVGLLCVRALGVRTAAAERYALAAGDALQRANILRDWREDLARGRLYIPFRIQTDDTDRDRLNQAAAQKSHFKKEYQLFVRDAGLRFGKAEALWSALPHKDRRRLWPTRAMVLTYRDMVNRLSFSGPAPRHRTLRLLWLTAFARCGG